MQLWIVEHFHLHQKVPVEMNHNIQFFQMLWFISTGTFLWRWKCSTGSNFSQMKKQCWVIPSKSHRSIIIRPDLLLDNTRVVCDWIHNDCELRQKKSQSNEKGSLILTENPQICVATEEEEGSSKWIKSLLKSFKRMKKTDQLKYMELHSKYNNFQGSDALSFYESEMILYRPNHLGALIRSKSFWTGPNYRVYHKQKSYKCDSQLITGYLSE